MLQIKRILFVMSLLVFTLSRLTAANSGADFLKVDISAYSGAISGAFTAIDGVIDAAVYNPAGLSKMTNATLMFSGMPWLGGTLFTGVTYASPQKKYPGIVLGVNLLFFNSLNIAQYDMGGNYINDHNLFDLAAGFFLSYQLPIKGFSAGAAARFIIRNLIDYNIFGIAFDASLMYKFSFLSFYSKDDKNVNIGLSLRNIGPNMIFSEVSQNDYSSRLPTSLNIGLKYRFLKTEYSQAWMVVEFTSFIYEGTRLYKIGFNYQPFSMLALRAGFQNGAEVKSFSFGFGINVSNIQLDYAFIPLNNQLSSIHSFTLSLKF